MKKIAFAGEYKVFTQLAAMYSDDDSNVNVKHRTMVNGEQLEILISRDPRFLTSRHGWAREAECMFLCVDAEDPKFTEHMYEEVKSAKLYKEKLILVANADELDTNRLERLKDLALMSEYPSIFCSFKNNVAYYTDGNNTSHHDLKSIFDQAAQKNVEAVLISAVVPHLDLEHERKHELRK